MSAVEATAVELLKAYGINSPSGLPLAPDLVSAWVQNKRFSPEAITRLAVGNKFGKLMHGYLLGNLDDSAPEETRFYLNNIGRNIVSHIGRGYPTYLLSYSGSREQNSRIDHALSESRSKKLKYGHGSSRQFTSVSEAVPEANRSANIAIVGHGAAGILIDRALRNHGFVPNVFEKRKSRGIWENENVYKRSRNNPFAAFFGDVELSAAPGPGESVRNFLTTLANGASVKISGVKKITPGYNFDHEIEFTDSTERKKFPIVINCSGLGSPRPLSDKSRMTTNVTNTYGGERWQRVLTVDQCRGKQFVMIGLGNSTAEMLRQIHEFQDQGVQIDYRILTHYPKEAVYQPEDTVEKDKRKYRVFRDISVPNLTSWQGDLNESRYDYFRALRTGKIVAGVKAWSKIGERSVRWTTSKSSYLDSGVYADQLFTLIGYAPTVDDLANHGIYADKNDHCARLDYDGEVQSNDLDGRVYKGYFAFGALTTNPHNKNAIVIPGMLYRLHDLVMSVVLRAVEASLQ